MPSRLVDCGSGCNNSQYAFNNPVSAYKGGEKSIWSIETSASQPSTCLHTGLVMPPTVFNDWYVLVNSFTKALVQRYGIATVRTWYFEVWNGESENMAEVRPETSLLLLMYPLPRLSELWGMRFPQDYIPLYNASVLAVKAVDEQLRVGGPATMQVGVLNSPGLA